MRKVEGQNPSVSDGIIERQQPIAYAPGSDPLSELVIVERICLSNLADNLSGLYLAATRGSRYLEIIGVHGCISPVSNIVIGLLKN